MLEPWAPTRPSRSIAKRILWIAKRILWTLTKALPVVF